MSDFDEDAASWCSSAPCSDDEESVDNDYYFRITHGVGNMDRRPSILRVSASSAASAFEAVKCAGLEAMTACGSDVDLGQVSPTGVATHSLIRGEPFAPGPFAPGEAPVIHSRSCLSLPAAQDRELSDDEEDDDCSPLEGLCLDDLSLYSDEDDAEPIAYNPSSKVVFFAENGRVQAEEKTPSRIEMFWRKMTKCLPRRPKHLEKQKLPRHSEFQEAGKSFSCPTMVQSKVKEHSDTGQANGTAPLMCDKDWPTSSQSVFRHDPKKSLSCRTVFQSIPKECSDIDVANATASLVAIKYRRDKHFVGQDSTIHINGNGKLPTVDASLLPESIMVPKLV